MARENDLVTLTEALSITCTVKLNVPTEVVEPDKVPVVALSVIPGGGEPALMDQR